MRPTTGESYQLRELKILILIYRKMQFESTLQANLDFLHVDVCVKMDSTIKSIL